MNLSRQDADLFFRLIGALHLFINRKLKMYPKIKTIDDYDDSDKEDRVAVRDALYQDIKLIDAFIEENPENFSKSELSIVSGWKHFVRGDFYIERFLKTQTILIGGDDVYGVLGFYQSFAEMIHSSNLPLSVGAVLLPFKGKIICAAGQGRIF